MRKMCKKEKKFIIEVTIIPSIKLILQNILTPQTYKKYDPETKSAKIDIEKCNFL